MPERNNGALVKIIYSGSVLRLVPHNSEGKTALDLLFATDGSKTTVATVQEDASMSGFGDTTQPYKTVKMTLS